MGKFINQPALSHFFYDDHPFSIISVGYNDFHVMKPAYAFRTQSVYTWHFIIAGSGTLEIYDKSYAVKAGDMFFIPTDTKMRYYPNPDDPWEYVWLGLKGEESVAFSEAVGFSTGWPVSCCVPPTCRSPQ